MMIGELSFYSVLRVRVWMLYRNIHLVEITEITRPYGIRDKIIELAQSQMFGLLFTAYKEGQIYYISPFLLISTFSLSSLRILAALSSAIAMNQSSYNISNSSVIRIHCRQFKKMSVSKASTFIPEKLFLATFEMTIPLNAHCLNTG